MKKEKKVRNLIDMVNDPAFTENIGLQKWATKENLKIAAKTYLLMTEKNIHSLSELDAKVALLQEQKKSANSSIVSLEHQILVIAETIKYAEQYRENKPFNDHYEKAKDQDKFLRKYESKIILFGGAERMLKRKGFTPTPANIITLKSTYQDLLSQKKNLSSIHKLSQSEIRKLEQMKTNMQKYLNITQKEFPQSFMKNGTPEL